MAILACIGFAAEHYVAAVGGRLLDGIPDDDGTLVTGTPMWRGRPSIDQNTGPMTALPMAARGAAIRRRARA